MTIAGFTIAEASWRGFDPIVHTISALAANDAPTIIFMSTIFILSGFADITVGWIDPHSHIEGLTERIGVAVEGCYPMFVVCYSWFWQRKRAEL